MHAYDFILVLFSFVYAAAVTHILSTAGEIIIASKRVRLSWFNAGWMCAALLFTCAWWIGLWDLHTVAVWNIGSVAFYFSVAAGIYLNARLVSPRIPERGDIDLRAFHADEGRKYLLAYTALSVVTVMTNAGLGQGGSAVQWPAISSSPPWQSPQQSQRSSSRSRGSKPPWSRSRSWDGFGTSPNFSPRCRDKRFQTGGRFHELPAWTRPIWASN